MAPDLIPKQDSKTIKATNINPFIHLHESVGLAQAEKVYPIHLSSPRVALPAAPLPEGLQENEFCVGGEDPLAHGSWSTFPHLLPKVICLMVLAIWA